MKYKPDTRNRPTDKTGMPLARNCTCKNKECRTKFRISFEDDPMCPKCGMVHCANCLHGYKKGELQKHTSRSGLEATNVTVTCPRCGWDIFDYEY